MRGLLMAVALVALPASSWGVPAAAADQEASPADKMVCKERQRTGTRFRSKICKTSAQWNAIAEADRAGLKETVDRPQISLERGN